MAEGRRLITVVVNFLFCFNFFNVFFLLLNLLLRLIEMGLRSNCNISFVKRIMMNENV